MECLCCVGQGPASGQQAPTFLWGMTRFGDNIEDEWVVVSLLLQVSRQFPDVSIQVQGHPGAGAWLACTDIEDSQEEAASRCGRPRAQACGGCRTLIPHRTSLNMCMFRFGTMMATFCSSRRRMRCRAGSSQRCPTTACGYVAASYTSFRSHQHSGSNSIAHACTIKCTCGLDQNAWHKLD